MQDDHDAAFLVYDHPTVESEAVGEWVDAMDSFIAAHQSTGKPAFVIFPNVQGDAARAGDAG